MIHNFDSGSLSHQEIRSALQEARFLNTLPTRQLLRLSQEGETRRFRAHTTMQQAGTRAEEVYVVQRGMVSVGLFQDHSPALWLYMSGPGTIADLYALLDPPIVPVTLYALTEVEALAVPRQVLKAVLAEEPAHAYELVKAMCTRLSLITQIAVNECFQAPPAPSVN